MPDPTPITDALARLDPIPMDTAAVVGVASPTDAGVVAQAKIDVGQPGGWSVAAAAAWMRKAGWSVVGALTWTRRGE